jgi:hypothetical protein
MRQSCSPLRFVSEQGDELVWRSEGTFAQVWWNDGLDGFELFAGITACIDFIAASGAIPFFNTSNSATLNTCSASTSAIAGL